MKNEIVSEEKKKPVLDEQTLGKLLEAAFVLQEHNRELRDLELGLDLKREQIESEDRAKSTPSPSSTNRRDASPAPPADYTFTLAQIVATQHQIQIRNLELEKAMSLVTERVTDIARASGAAIGVLAGNKVRYRTASGLHALKSGSEVAKERALCLPCIRDGQVFRCSDVNPEFLVDTEECRRRGIQSLIAVPIFHEGVAAGGLELYYSAPNAFCEQDVHTCQLMAGLVTEALARDEEHTWKQSLASERAVVLEALEKLKPNLAGLTEPAPAKAPPAKPPVAASSDRAYICPQCGNKLVAGEQFCGQCGLPRKADGASIAPHKTASSPMRDERKTNELSEDLANEPRILPELTPELTEIQHPETSLAASIEAQVPELLADHSEHSEDLAGSTGEESWSDDLALIEKRDLANHSGLENSTEEDEAAEPEVALTHSAAPGDWSSAASARDFLEQLAADKQQGALARFWATRRGDIYLAVAVILVACVIRWGIWSSHSVIATGTQNPAATSHHKAAPDADLSAFDRMLISLGLAEAPQPPEDKGNPSTQVWVDLHTALYYCPGTDLYGKTPKGKYTTQRDAQLDQYEPAYRKPCE